MEHFWNFWWSCIWAGWEVGHHLFAFVEGFCVIVAAAMRWIEKRGWEKSWEKTEAAIMKSAVILLAVSFVVSTFFVAPFLKYSEQHDRADKLGTSLASTSNQLSVSQTQLASLIVSNIVTLRADLKDVLNGPKPSLEQIRARARPVVKGLHDLGDRFMAASYTWNKGIDENDYQREQAAWNDFHNRFLTEYSIQYSFRVEVLVEQLAALGIDVTDIDELRPSPSRFTFSPLADSLEKKLQQK